MTTEIVKWKKGSRVKNRPDAGDARDEIRRIDKKYGAAKAEHIVKESEQTDHRNSLVVELSNPLFE